MIVMTLQDFPNHSGPFLTLPDPPRHHEPYLIFLDLQKPSKTFLDPPRKSGTVLDPSRPSKTLQDTLSWTLPDLPRIRGKLYFVNKFILLDIDFQ